MTKSTTIDLSKFGLDPIATVGYNEDTGEVHRISIRGTMIEVERGDDPDLCDRVSAHLAQKIADRKAQEADNG